MIIFVPKQKQKMTDALKATSHKRKRKLKEIETKVEVDHSKNEQKSFPKSNILQLKEAWDIIKYNFSTDNFQTVKVETVDGFFASAR